MVKSLHLPPCKPLLFNVTPAGVEEHTTRLITTLSDLVNKIIKQDGDYTFVDTILPFIDAENLRLREMRVIQFYRSTSTNPEIREASRQASRLLINAESELYTSFDLHTAFSAVRSKSESLGSEHQYYLQKILEAFDENGLSIPEPEKRMRFREIARMLNFLRIEGLKNLDSDATGIWFSPNELEGLPKSFLEKRQNNSGLSPSLHNDNNPTDLKFWVSAKDPDVLPVLKFATNAKTREQAYVMRHRKAPGNVSLYREIITLRDESARLFGFRNHADFRLSSKVIQTPEAVQKLLNDLQNRLQPKKQEEITNLLRTKQKHTSAPSAHLYLWDKPFYSRVFQEDSLFNQALIMEYFSLGHCILKMFEIFEQMFSIRIETFQPGPTEVWHETVTLYTVWEVEAGSTSFLGWLYIDPYPREGKYQHFGHYLLQPGCTMSTGERHYPAAAIVMNLPPPTNTQPPLLLHEHLRRLFHELGHIMHSMLSNTTCARFHGPPKDDRDFVEAVSMMFENFLWTSEHMSKMSLHYTSLSPEYLEAWKLGNPGSPLPPKHLLDTTIEHIIQAKEMSGALEELSKIWHSKFDMAIHSPQTPQDLANLDLQVLWNKSLEEITGLRGPESEKGRFFKWSFGFSGFRAPVSGYDAGYYTYVLSRVISDDLFYTDFRGDTMNPERGRRYRDIVLRPGGSRPSREILREFLGRDPNDDAYNEEHGMV